MFYIPYLLDAFHKYAKYFNINMSAATNTKIKSALNNP